MAQQKTVALACHAWTPPGPTHGIEVEIRRVPDGPLACAFRLAGELGHVRVPPPSPPRFTMQLWEHTCFELFVAIDGAPGYHEFNLAPSRAWAAFEFARYREVEALGGVALAPRIATRTTPERLEVDASIALELLSPAHRTSALRIGLAAVVEATDGALSYWALAHPPGKPDFHHADAFALRLSA